jgi:hypothetical protein
MFTQKEQKTENNFICNLCDFKGCKRLNYEKHLTTRKHLNAYNCLHEKSEKEPSGFICECGSTYKHRQSLYVHKKKCKKINNILLNETVEETPIKTTDELKILTNLVLDVIKRNSELQKQNEELQKQIIEPYKASSTINSNNTHINSHNKTFNLQFFLNEQCKDAMNLTEFVNSIQLKLSDLENVGKMGYIEGISQIIINQLNDTDMYKRPMHCSDIKREVLYIKDEDKWEKEDSSNTKIKKAVKDVEKKNINLISNWTDSHPKFKESTSYENDTYLKLIVASTDGDDENVSNVIKKISKNVVIEKGK